MKSGRFSQNWDLESLISGKIKDVHLILVEQFIHNPFKNNILSIRKKQGTIVAL